MPAYTLTFTITDATSTGSGELAWGIYTASDAGGTELLTGTATSGVEVTTGTINDAALAHGSNTRYLYVIDGAGNILDQSFTVTADLENPVPVLTSISPESRPAGTGEFTLTATGSDFVGTSVVRWDGGDLPTTFISATELQATVAANLIEDIGTASVTVFNPAPVGGLSDPVTFTITTPPLPAVRPRPQPADLITVSIFPPLGVFPRDRLDYLDINPQVTAVHFRSAMPGGWSDASVGIEHPLARYGEGLERPYLTRPPYLRPFAHVVIKRGPVVVFEGRLGPDTSAQYGAVTGFSVNGYGMVATRDNPYRTTDSTTVTSGTLLRDMIAATAPHLRSASGDDWEDPGVAHAFNEMDTMFLADALDQVAQEGNTAGQQVDWWVYEDQWVKLRTRIEPLEPDYQVDYGPVVTSYHRNPNTMVGAVWHERMASGSTVKSSTPIVDPEFVERHGFLRGELLRLGEVTETAANAIRRTYLRTHSKPTVSASLEFGPDDVVTTPSGQPRAKELVRAGSWWRLGRDTELLMAVSTDYDVTADVLRVEVGEFVPGLDTLIAMFQKDQLRSQRKINRFGGKER